MRLAEALIDLRPSPARPEKAPEIASFGELQLVSYSAAARMFSGDFYRYHQGPHGLFLALGDVRGKGLDAAVIMAMIQEMIEQRETAVDGGHALVELVVALDRMLRLETAPNCFASMVLGLLAPSGRLQIVNAGHCPPLIVGPGRASRSIGSHGPLVGLLPGMSWSAGEERLLDGETLCLYSDGVTEIESPSGEEYGQERLARRLTALAARPLEDSIPDLLRSMRQFAGASSDADDTTLLLIRRRNVRAQSRSAEACSLSCA